jgi:anti-sigma regulatory factor (Ser/Thr protein kinase)
MSLETKLTIGNDLSELDRVHSWVEGFQAEHALSADVAFAVTLSLDELLTNIISYGYPHTVAHAVWISMRLEADCLHVRIEDQAEPFNPLTAEEPDIDAPIEDRRIGGLGIHFVRTVMDEVAYQFVDGRNVLTLMKRSGAA